MEYHSPYLAFDGVISSSVFRSLLIILFFLLHAVNVPVDVLKITLFIKFFMEEDLSMMDMNVITPFPFINNDKGLISPFLQKI